MSPSSYLYLLALSAIASCQPATDQNAVNNSVLSFYTDFEAGSLGDVQQLSAHHWQCAVAGETDADHRNRQASWYYFRVEGARDSTLTIDLTDLVGEYNYQPGAHAITAQTRPVISYDNRNWRHLSDQEVSWDEEKVILRLHLKPRKDTFWIAHQPPYTTAQLKQLLAQYQEEPYMKIQSMGESAAGESLVLLTLTNTAIPLEQKKVVWLMARQHAWESTTSWVVEAAIRYLMDTTAGRALLDKIVFQVMPMGDPDGVARGGVRFNTFGHDLNRNWDLVRPAEMPEIQAQKQAMLDWLSQGHPMDLFLTLHNTESADYVQGPDLPAGHKLLAYMTAYTSFEAEGLRPMPETTTMGKPGRMTVNQALWAAQGVPAYLMEMKVERVEKLGANRTVDDWLALGAGLVQALAAAVE